MVLIDRQCSFMAMSGTQEGAQKKKMSASAGTQEAAAMFASAGTQEGAQKKKKRPMLTGFKFNFPSSEFKPGAVPCQWADCVTVTNRHVTSRRWHPSHPSPVTATETVGRRRKMLCQWSRVPPDAWRSSRRPPGRGGRNAGLQVPAGGGGK
jgi:hypothetical protein